MLNFPGCRFVDFVEKVRDQHGDVVATIAQGRQAQIHDIQAVIQVFAEGAMLYHGGQVAIGCGQDARLDRNAVRGADRPDFAFLQCPQQLGLQFEREFANLVEKDRSTSSGHK